MTPKLHKGQTVYFLQKPANIRTAKIVNISGEFCTIRFADTGGGIRIRTNRLFLTEEEAEKNIKKSKTEEAEKITHSFRDFL